MSSSILNKMEAKLRISLLNNLVKKNSKKFHIRRYPTKTGKLNFLFHFFTTLINGTFWRHFFILFKKIVLVFSSDISFFRYQNQLQIFKYGPELFISFFSSHNPSETNDVWYTLYLCSCNGFFNNQILNKVKFFDILIIWAYHFL